MKVYTINVTALDIRRGKAGNADNCPIARAARRATRNRTLSVGTTVLSYGGREIKLPPRARNFVSAFDTEATVKPFSFKLRVR